ncbi:MAG: ATP-binding cassette domain-containing protein, partial [Planctomycetota bacterium]
RQRVAVARALVNRPALLLADEPTASVDAANRQKILDLLRDSCREGDVSLLVVTHDEGVASQFGRVDPIAEINRAALAAV